LKSNTLGFAFALAAGALLGVGATFWFFAQATHHVTTLQPPDVAMPEDAPSVPDRNRIMELVCRDVLSSPNAATDASGNAPPIYFLAIAGGQDPTPELLAALRDLPTPVRGYSSGTRQDGRITDKETGKPGTAVTIQRMWMRTRNEVHVQVRLDAGGGARPREVICTLSRANGPWKAIGREPVQ
jgi:hypothetical protein